MNTKGTILLFAAGFAILMFCSCQALEDAKDALSSISPSHKAAVKLDETTEPVNKTKAEPRINPVEKTEAGNAGLAAVKNTPPLANVPVDSAKKKKHVSISEVLKKGEALFYKVSEINDQKKQSYLLNIGRVFLSPTHEDNLKSGMASFMDGEGELSKVGKINSTDLDIWLTDKEFAKNTEFAKDPLKLGQKVYLVLYANNRFVVKKSRVVAEGSDKDADKDSTLRFAVLDLPASKIFNGALVLNKAKEIAGVVTVDEKVSFIMSVEVSELKAFAEKNGWQKRYGIEVAKKVIPLKASEGLWLGMQVQDLTPELAESFGLTNDNRGVLVSKVFENGPAFEAGIVPGDLITRLAKKKVTSIDDLPAIIKDVKADQKLSLVIRRDRKSLSKNIIPIQRAEK